MPESALRDTIQAALMAASDPLSVDALQKIFSSQDRPPREEVSDALKALAAECEGRSFSLVHVASGWRYQINQDYAAVIGRLWEQRSPRYSQALLETLALIAYRQPITRGEIEKVRGVPPSTGTMQTLTDRNWVRVVGYKQVPGRPALYGTTKEFLDYFGLKTIKDMPPLPEPKSKENFDSQMKSTGVDGEDAKGSEAELPVDEEPPQDSPERTPTEVAGEPPQDSPERMPTEVAGESPQDSPERMPTEVAGESPQRLQKLIAQTGLASRRTAETWIKQGRVEINGRVARLGERAGPDDVVMVDGQALPAEPRVCQVLAYHKPAGEIASRSDEQGRPTVFDRLPEPGHGRWISVGRLDFQTSGLLLFTTDGQLANRLMHPGSQIQRRYLARVRGRVDAALLARLTAGVELEDGMARFETLHARDETGSNRWYEVTLCEGRNREVRRLWEAVGCEVSRLMRIGYGPISLARDHSAGESRWLDGQEIQALQAACRDVGQESSSTLS